MKKKNILISQFTKCFFAVIICLLLMDNVETKRCMAETTVQEQSTVSEIQTETVTLPKKVEVTEIEVADYENELYVGKTLNLSTSVFPANATEPQITYSSSNNDIASVNSSGVVKGIASGNVTISLIAGSVIKNIDLHVKVNTIKIEMNSYYLVLKENESFQLKGKCEPETAGQDLTFKSADDNIASVDSEGIVTAKKLGSTTVIVNNGDLSCAVSVIVNREVKTIQDSEMIEENYLAQNNQESDQLQEQIYLDKSVTFDQDTIDKLTGTTLKKLYDSGHELVIQSSRYRIIIQGNDIVNYHNELITELIYTENSDGMEFIINDGNELPGRIFLDIMKEDSITNRNYKYLYKYNNSNQKYERINYSSGERISIDLTGKYKLTYKKINTFSCPFLVLIISTVVTLAIGFIFISIRKKHWLW